MHVNPLLSYFDKQLSNTEILFSSLSVNTRFPLTIYQFLKLRVSFCNRFIQHSTFGCINYSFNTIEGHCSRCWGYTTEQNNVPALIMKLTFQWLVEKILCRFTSYHLFCFSILSGLFYICTIKETSAVLKFRFVCTQVTDFRPGLKRKSQRSNKGVSISKNCTLDKTQNLLGHHKNSSVKTFTTSNSHPITSKRQIKFYFIPVPKYFSISVL